MNTRNLSILISVLTISSLIGLHYYNTHQTNATDKKRFKVDDFAQVFEFHENAYPVAYTTLDKMHIEFVKGLDLFEQKDYPLAFEYLIRSSNLGSVNAQAFVGYMYLAGLGANKSPRSAIEWFEESAERGNSFSQVLMGLFESYRSNYKKALFWFEEGAMLDNPIAQSCLGDIYRLGLGVKKNTAEAIKWYEKAADQNEVHALLNLAIMYEFGDGVKVDHNRSEQYSSRVLKRENLQTLNYAINLEDNTFKKNKDSSKSTSKKGKKAKQTLIYAQLVGSPKTDSSKISKDTTYVFNYFHRNLYSSIHNRLANSFNYVGTMYRDQKGVTRDRMTAKKWFGKACDAGFQPGCDNYKKIDRGY